jgi:hypothetical protein
MDCNRSQGLRAVGGVLAASLCLHLNPAISTASADQARTDPRALLPVSAEELMPLKPRRGVYLVTEGPTQGTQVPFTFEPHGDRWILTKNGLAQHELHRDRQGNLLIDRETDLREERQIEYASPVMLLPATVNSNTSLTGKTRVTVRNIRSRSIKYRGTCDWELAFIGVRLIDTSTGTLPAYRLRGRREILLPRAHISMTIEFEYMRGNGMVATGIEQVIHSLGLFTNRDSWHLEQRP